MNKRQPKYIAREQVEQELRKLCAQLQRNRELELQAGRATQRIRTYIDVPVTAGYSAHHALLIAHEGHLVSAPHDDEEDNISVRDKSISMLFDALIEVGTLLAAAKVS